jgi:hypothetical protein
MAMADAVFGKKIVAVWKRLLAELRGVARIPV